MSQTLTRLLVHIVFSTKHRENLILPSFEKDLHRYMGGICRALGSPVIEIGGTENHVHVLTSMSKTITLADLVMNVKKDSSKWIKTLTPEASTFRWQDGYAAFSIGESAREALCRYIQTQKDHHRTRTFEDEVRSLVQMYGVTEFDERYAWD